MTLWKHLSRSLSLNYYQFSKTKLFQIESAFWCGDWLMRVTSETRTFLWCLFCMLIAHCHRNRPCINYWFRIPTNAYIVIRIFEHRPCHVRCRNIINDEYICGCCKENSLDMNSAQWTLIPICEFYLKWRDPLFWAVDFDACKLNHIRKTQTARKTTRLSRIAKIGQICRSTLVISTTLEPINAKASLKHSRLHCHKKQML